MLPPQEDNRIVFFEILGLVETTAAFVGLLVKVNSPQPELGALNVRRDVDYVVIGSHITQEAYEAAFVELDELLRQPDLVEPVLGQLIADERVSRESIKIRERIVLPLLVIQQYALQKIGEGAPNRELYEKIVTRSLYGNINASRNSA